MAQSLGVVHVFVFGKPPEDGLPQQPDQRMTAILAGAYVGELVARYGAETEDIVKFTIGQQSRIGGNNGAKNWSISRRSKSSLRTPSADSPVGFPMTASRDLD